MLDFPEVGGRLFKAFSTLDHPPAVVLQEDDGVYSVEVGYRDTYGNFIPTISIYPDEIGSEPGFRIEWTGDTTPCYLVCSWKYDMGDRDTPPDLVDYDEAKFLLIDDVVSEVYKRHLQSLSKGE